MPLGQTPELFTPDEFAYHTTRRTSCCPREPPTSNSSTRAHQGTDERVLNVGVRLVCRISRGRIGATMPFEFQEPQGRCKSEPDWTFAKKFDQVQSPETPILFQSERRTKHIKECFEKQIHEGDPNPCVEFRGYQFDLFEFF